VRSLKNLTVSTTLQKRMGFYEVTGVRALFFRNVSMGEIPPEAGRGQNSPVDTLLKNQAESLGTEEKPILFNEI
jgi:hypothetical protein